MKRENLKNSFFKKKNPHFIGAWNIENNILCNEIISCFESNKDLHKAGLAGLEINPEVKKTTDMGIEPNQLNDINFKCLKDYVNELHKCFVDYQNQWPFLKEMIKSLDVGSFNIQKYEPGDHFSKVHTERSNISNIHRVFAWMTYLNDVDDGGKTNFPHFDIKVKPETGKTLIWPSEWTHAHSGEVVKKGFKYIVTGWMHLPYDLKEINI